MFMSLESSRKAFDEMQCHAKSLQHTVVRRKVPQADSWHLETS